MTFQEIILSFHPCDENVIAEVERHCRIERWAKGDFMVKSGTMPRKLFFIRDGIVRVGYSADGVEDTLLFGVTGDVWMEMSAWFGDTDGAVFDQECMTDTEAFVLSFDDCRRLMEQYPAWSNWLLQTALGQLWMLQKRYQWFNSRDASDRYEAFIQRRKLVNHVPVKYVAQYIGVTASSLSRIRAGKRQKQRQDPSTTDTND